MSLILGNRDLSMEHCLPLRLHNIAIGGRKGHGKDCLANWFHYCYGHRVTAFATALKQKAAELIVTEQGLPLDEAIRRLNHPVEKEQYRVMLQNIGARERDEYEDFWVDKSGIKSARGLNVVSDARFENELGAIHRKGGISIFVRARWNERTLAEDPTLAHISEALGPEHYDITATVPRGLNEAIHYYQKFSHALGFPPPEAEKAEEFAVWMKQHIEKGEK